MSQTLVVVDMQDCFLNDMKCYWGSRPDYTADYKPFIHRVAKLVRRCRQRNIPTIFLEYANVEHELEDDEVEAYIGTHPIIKAANPRAHRVLKYKDSGAPEVLKECRKHKFPLDFVLCGVNADACVKATASGLHSFPVRVIGDCTRNVYDDKPYMGWGRVLDTSEFFAGEKVAA